MTDTMEMAKATQADWDAAIAADDGAIAAARSLADRSFGATQGEMRDARKAHLAEAFARHRLSAELAARSGGAATGPWLRVGTFEPDPGQQYIVQGGFRTSIKWGSEIDADNLFAAVLSDPRNQQHGKIRL